MVPSEKLGFMPAIVNKRASFEVRRKEETSKY
jgi:hypothetical protein